MPVDNPEIVQAAGLNDIHAEQGRRQSVTKAVDEKTVQQYYNPDPEYDNIPTEDELHGPNALRRVAAPIPWAVYTVAFVELCERFSYYGTQVVCKFFWGGQSLDIPD